MPVFKKILNLVGGLINTCKITESKNRLKNKKKRCL